MECHAICLSQTLIFKATSGSSHTSRVSTASVSTPRAPGYSLSQRFASGARCLRKRSLGMLILLRDLVFGAGAEKECVVFFSNPESSINDEI